MKSIWTQPMQLIDLNSLEDETLREHFWAGILEFILKHRFAQDFMQFAHEVLQWLREIELQGGFSYAEGLMQYILHQTEGKNSRVLIELAEHYLSPDLGEKTMTFAQQLRQEGMQLGIKRGRKEGRQEGRQEGEQALLLRILERKFKCLPELYRKQVVEADAKILLILGERVLEATSLDEVFIG